VNLGLVLTMSWYDNTPEVLCLVDPIKATEEGRAVYFTGEVLVWTSC
jgi:hypothetical protein